MTRAECLENCRGILSRFSGKYIDKFPDFYQIEYALKKGKAVCSLKVKEKPNEHGVIGAVDYDESTPVECGVGLPCHSYEEIVERLSSTLKAYGCAPQTAYQPTLLECC